MNEIQLGNTNVGNHLKPYFIADLAANHDGELSRAKDLIWIAKEAGAHCAKFQHFVADKIVNDVEFQKINSLETHQSGWKASVSEIYDQYHFRREWTEEIAKELDMTINDVKESLKNSGRHVSMDAPLVEGEDSNLYDVLNSGESPNPDRTLLHESLRTEIERALETLTPREADVVRLYFGLAKALSWSILVALSSSLRWTTVTEFTIPVR